MNHGGITCGAATFSVGLSASPYCLDPSLPDGACQLTGSLSPCEKNLTLPRILMNDRLGMAKQYLLDRDPSRDPASGAAVLAHIPNRMRRELLAPSLSPACLPA